MASLRRDIIFRMFCVFFAHVLIIWIGLLVVFSVVLIAVCICCNCYDRVELGLS